mmetsp:Transcript_33787/g.52635  ORF Transcript_33787/g.52635 Transcript_33787/m.52635 type:complete len:84 (+) Transcript_33787:1716-1967(+)
MTRTSRGSNQHQIPSPELLSSCPPPPQAPGASSAAFNHSGRWAKCFSCQSLCRLRRRATKWGIEEVGHCGQYAEEQGGGEAVG